MRRKHVWSTHMDQNAKAPLRVSAKASLLELPRRGGRPLAFLHLVRWFRRSHLLKSGCQIHCKDRFIYDVLFVR